MTLVMTLLTQNDLAFLLLAHHWLHIVFVVRVAIVTATALGYSNQK